jgi:kinesin family protein 5
VNDLQRDIEEQKALIEELKKTERREKEEEKERRKEIMLGEMMAKIDMVSWLSSDHQIRRSCEADTRHGSSPTDATNEKIRRLLTAMEYSESSGDSNGSFTAQTREMIRSHIAENQDQIRDLQEKLRASQEEAEMNRTRRGEVERMLEKREGAYEELLGELT